jgi:tRNA G18 (ribose-2'-O)-methylase SpoU
MPINYADLTRPTLMSPILGTFLVEGRKVIEHLLARSPARTLLLGQAQIEALASAVYPDRFPSLLAPVGGGSGVPALSATLAAASEDCKAVWRAALPSAVIASEKTLARCSQSVAASGFLAEFPLLSNVVYTPSAVAGARAAGATDDGHADAEADDEEREEAAIAAAAAATAAAAKAAAAAEAAAANEIPFQSSARARGGRANPPTPQPATATTPEPASAAQQHARSLANDPTRTVAFHGATAAAPAATASAVSEHPLAHPFRTRARIRAGASTSTNTSTRAADAGVPAWRWDAGGLILSGLTDPGNIGTLIRSAVALGRRQVLLLDCADPYNTKCVQATVGAIVDAAVVVATGAEFEEYLASASASASALALAPVPDAAVAAGEAVEGAVEVPYTIALVPDAAADLLSLPTSLPPSGALSQQEQQFGRQLGLKPRRPWVIVGSEAHGVPMSLQTAATARARVAMAPGPDGVPGTVGSLNASVAGAIACYIVSSSDNKSH